VGTPNLDQLLAEGVRGQRVFVRADLNAPLRDGVLSDDTRLRASVPTLKRLLEAGARVVVASHLGRPGGVKVPELSLRPIAPRLSELLGTSVSFCDDCVGDAPAAAIANLEPGQVLLLENLRFHAGETRNDTDFARALASLADAYVDDAFGTAHRAHASTVGVPALLADVAAGELLRSGLRHLRSVREPVRPLLVVLGGAKVSDKIAVLDALAPHADTLAIGGAMAYSFLAARGEGIGNSLVEADSYADARRVEEACHIADTRLLLPTDHVIAEQISPDAPTRVVDKIPEGWMGVDIGPDTARRYSQAAQEARTVFWNGPMGIFEIEPFAAGTETVARAVAAASGLTVVGGGDSLAAIAKLGLGSQIDHLSTGGGASLEFVQGLALPGVSALEL